MLLTKRRIALLATFVIATATTLVYRAQTGDGWSFADYQNQQLTWIECGGFDECAVRHSKAAWPGRDLRA